MRRFGGFMAVVALMSAVLLGACSSDEVDRDEAIDELVEAGFPEDQAECFVDGIIDEFGEDRVVELAQAEAEPEDLSPEEEEALAAIAVECLS